MDIDARTLLEQLQSLDENVRYQAWRAAGPVGAAAVRGLCDLMASPDKGIAYSAKGALDTVVHYSARPGAGKETHLIAVELLKVASTNLPVLVRANALHLLGFVGDMRIVPGLAMLLVQPDIREEARMALERIPGSASLEALKRAQRTVPADFKPNIDQSLHNRALTPENAGISGS